MFGRILVIIEVVDVLFKIKAEELPEVGFTDSADWVETAKFIFNKT